MYAGHIGVALGLRRVSGAPALWLLVLAAQGPDWIDAAAALLMLPRGDPGRGSHGLPGVAVVATCAALIAAAIAGGRGAGGSRARAALLVGVAYAAHWACDFVTGRKPTWPGGPIVGLDLYQRPVIDFAIEAAVVAVGWALWRGSLPRPRGRGEQAVRAGLLVALVVLQALANRAIVRGGRLV